ncbi:MAG: bifunctional phosphoglucose/phosphomannose isomerase [Anaerolineae bacterium]|nr:bifunctional phosphoglucose/phosphomannose isomerase [Anaerolineae bacterium]
MSVNLNDQSMYPKFDPEDMLQRIIDLPQQVRDAWAIAQTAPLPEAYRSVRRIVVAGMGGSAIAGDLVRGLTAREGHLPFEVVREYALPEYVDKETLVVFSSYSGYTEETLSALAHAKQHGAMILVMTTGGAIADEAEKIGAPVWRYTYSSAPRAAIGYSLILLAGMCSRLHALADIQPALEEALPAVEALRAALLPGVPTAENPAKQLAQALEGRLPVIYGSAFLSAVARRWKTQINENAKQWAIWDELSELNHNAVIGFGLPDKVREQATAVFVRSPLDHPRIKVRWDVTRELLEQVEIPVHEVTGEGQSTLSQMLTLIHLGDFVSYYLAALNEVDPTRIENIVLLKERLAAVE